MSSAVQVLGSNPAALSRNEELPTAPTGVAVFCWKSWWSKIFTSNNCASKRSRKERL
jgi:hypothetical protein